MIVCILEIASFKSNYLKSISTIDTQFSDFIYSSQMVPLNNRIVWLHVNLPGQELDASDLHVKKYPSLEEIGDELISVLDYLNVSQIVCMGHGVGANIAVHFSDKHPSRLVLFT